MKEQMKITAQILIAYHAKKYIKRRREAKQRYLEAYKLDSAKKIIKPTGGNPNMMKKPAA